MLHVGWLTRPGSSWGAVPSLLGYPSVCVRDRVNLLLLKVPSLWVSKLLGPLFPDL